MQSSTSWILACCFLSAACGKSAGKTGDADPCVTAVAGDPITVNIVQKQHLDGVQGSPTFQSATIAGVVPAGCYSSIVADVHVTTDCSGSPPSGQNWPPNCDPYDRLAQLTLADTGSTPLFLLDAVTSFGGTTDWQQDVTDYASLLVGTHSYHIDVDSWADGAGMTAGTAASHDVDVNLILTPGPPPRKVLAVVPLFRDSITTTAAMTGSLTAPAGTTSGALQFFTSGHGGNGNPPCDEFCQKENDISIDGMSLYADSPWVDCSDNCDQVQISGKISCGGESFQFICQQNPTSCPSSAVAPRSNWCPSKIISPFALALPAADLTGTHSVTLQVPMVSGSWSVGLAAVFYQ